MGVFEGCQREGNENTRKGEQWKKQDAVCECHFAAPSRQQNPGSSVFEQKNQVGEKVEVLSAPFGEGMVECELPVVPKHLALIRQIQREGPEGEKGTIRE